MTAPDNEALNESRWLQRLQALFEVFLLSGLLTSLLAAVPFSLLADSGAALMRDPLLVCASILLEASMALILLMVVLRLHRESLGSLGLCRRGWIADSVFGLLLVPLLLLLNIAVSEVFRIFFPKYYIDTNPLTEIIRTPAELGLFIVCALFAGGIKEELQRAFIIRRFERHLGGAKFGLVLWSVAFGVGHYLQGVQGMVVAGLLGFVFGAVFLLRGRLIAPMVAHGMYNTLALLGYWFSLRVTQ